MQTRYLLRRLSEEGRHAIHFYYDVCPESPSGRRVVYFRFSDGAPGPGDVVVADRDGKNASVVLSVSDCMGTHTAARQQWVGEDIVACCIGAEGRLRTICVSLRDGSRRELPGALRMVSPVAPVGLTTLHDFAELASNMDDAVCRMDLTTGKVEPLFTVAEALRIRPLGRDFPGAALVLFMHTKWSPGGKRLLVMASNLHRLNRNTNARGINSLFVAEVDGSRLRYLGEEYHHPTWGPDDDHVYSFRPGARGGGLGMKWWGGYQDLVSIPVDGGEGQPVFRSLAGKHLSPSPDGLRMVADAPNWPEPGYADILVYEANGSSALPVITMTQADFSQRGCHIHPAWSRDGKRIYFNSMESGTRGFYAVDIG